MSETAEFASLLALSCPCDGLSTASPLADLRAGILSLRRVVEGRRGTSSRSYANPLARLKADTGKAMPAVTDYRPYRLRFRADCKQLLLIISRRKAKTSLLLHLQLAKLIFNLKLKLYHLSIILVCGRPVVNVCPQRSEPTPWIQSYLLNSFRTSLHETRQPCP